MPNVRCAVRSDLLPSLPHLHPHPPHITHHPGSVHTLTLTPHTLQVMFQVAFLKLRPPLPPYCPPFFAHLLTACWLDDPAQRPPFTAVLQWLEEERARGGSGSVRGVGGGSVQGSEAATE